jgi:CheY-like chemotaxis protein
MRVLIVEDNRDAARSLQMLLKLYGHEARVANSGRTGLAAARSWLPDVLLCDLGLPEVDGFGVAEALRDDPETAGIRRIAITGYGRPEDRRRSGEAGFELHLTKPVDPVVIKRLLEDEDGGGVAAGRDMQPA